MAEDRKDGKKMTKAEFTYRGLLKAFPRPGGEGAHAAFFKAGVLGFKAGIDEDRIVADTLAAVPPGGRPLREGEVEQGVRAGFGAAARRAAGLPDETVCRPAGKPKVPKDAIARIVNAFGGPTADDIAAKSPVPVLGVPDRDSAALALSELYSPGEYLYIGGHNWPGKPGETVRQVQDWIAALASGGPAWPHIVPNPLTGRAAPTKAGGSPTYRGDNCVASFRYAVVESDSLPLEHQIAFWLWADLPVEALVLSGGKSIHGWVRVDCADKAEWDAQVEGDLFPNYLEPLGADPTCKTDARLSRLPGYDRSAEGPDKQGNARGVQRLLWLAPGGGKVRA